MSPEEYRTRDTLAASPSTTNWAIPAPLHLQYYLPSSYSLTCSLPTHRLVGLVGVCLESGRSQVRIPLAPGFFSGSSHTSDLKIDTPVATLPGAWHYRVSTGTGRPGVSILWLGEVECLICSFYLSVAARKIVWADPSLRYTSLLLGR